MATADIKSSEMRVIATLILLVVAIAAQAITPVAPHSDNLALPTGVDATQHVSSANTSSATAATDQGHDSGEASPEHCHIGGHCSPSALDTDSLLYHAQYLSAARTAGRIKDEAEPGFTLLPYRPPSPF
jgi:hypothetical protein